MKEQPNKAAVKDGLPTAKEILDKHALKLFPETYTGEISTCIIDAMQEYSDQQNAELREQLKETENSLDGTTYNLKRVVKKCNGLTERVKELDGTVSELRTAFANYWVSEGCSCCRDSDNHRDAEHAIGELLGVVKHDDDSGYDFNQYQTIYK